MGKCCGILLLPSGEENYSAAAYFSVLVTFFSFFRNSGENTCVSVATATTTTPPRKRGVNTDLPPSLVFSHAIENSRNCSCGGIRPYLHFPSPCQKKKGNENRVLSSLFLSRVFFLLFSVIFSQSGVPHPCFCVFHKKRKKRDTCTHGSFPSVIKARSLSSEIFYTSRKKGENRVCALVGTFKTWIPSSKTLQQAPFSFYLFLFPFLSFFATCNLFPLSSPLPFFCQFLLRETNVGVRNYLDSLQSLFHK